MRSGALRPESTATAALLAALALALSAAAAATEPCLEFGGLQRCWLQAAPGAAAGVAPGSVPLLIDLHGLKSSNTQIQQYGLGTLYNDEGFFVAWPQGVGTVGVDSSWHAGKRCCGAALEEDVDDEGFLLALIDTLLASNPELDSRRVYFSGHSNGCIMSNTMALKHSHVVAAMGCFSGYSTVSPPGDYRPMHSIISQGTADPLISYRLVENYVEGGGLITKSSLKEMNQCAATPETRDYGGGNKVDTYSCISGVQVALVTLDGAGHTVTGPDNQGPYTDLDDSTSTRQLVWDFISRGSLPAVPHRSPPPPPLPSPPPSATASPPARSLLPPPPPSASVSPSRAAPPPPPDTSGSSPSIAHTSNLHFLIAVPVTLCLLHMSM